MRPYRWFGAKNKNADQIFWSAIPNLWSPFQASTPIHRRRGVPHQYCGTRGGWVVSFPTRIGIHIMAITVDMQARSPIKFYYILCLLKKGVKNIYYDIIHTSPFGRLSFIFLPFLRESFLYAALGRFI